MWHLTLATVGRQRLWTTDADRVRALRALARICGPALLLFCLVDDHAHVVVTGARGRVGRLAASLNRAIGTVAAGPMAATDIRPVAQRAHLTTLVGYVLRQPVRHGLELHPALWPGSCFADLVGIRLLPGFEPSSLRRALPRMRSTDPWRLVDCEPTWLASPNPIALRALGPSGVLEAIGHALAAVPTANTTAGVDARAAAIQICLAAGLRPGQVADELGLSRRGARRLADREIADLPRLTRAVGLRAALLDRTVQPNASEQRSLRRARFLAGELGS